MSGAIPVEIVGSGGAMPVEIVGPQALVAGATSNADALHTHAGLLTPATLLNYPNVGPQKTQRSDSEAYQPGNAPFYLGAGNSGVLRSFFIIPGTLAEKATLRVRIYVDAGDIADLTAPPADKLALDLPLRLLFGVKYDSPTVGKKYADNEFLSLSLVDDTENLRFVIQWKFPIPYSNGILVQVGTYSTGTWTPRAVETWCYSWFNYEAGTLPVWPYSGYRLKAVPYTFNMTDEEAAYTVISEAAGPGRLVGLWFSLADSFTMERNFGMKEYAASTYDWQTSSLEDMIGTEAYFFANGVGYGHDWAVLFSDGTSAEAMRLFLSDPFTWTSGCLGAFMPALSATGVAEGFAVYYQKPGA